MPSIAQTPASARFLANNPHIAGQLRGLEDPPLVPSAAELDRLDRELSAIPENRRGKRAARAHERRSTEPLPKPRRNLTRAELRKREHERAQDRRYADRLKTRSADWTPAPLRIDATGKAWRPIPSDVFRMSQDVVSCTSSAAWRYWARRCHNKVALGALRRAALLPRGDGTTRRTFADEAARRIAALGLALIALAKHTARKGCWQHIVRGIPIAAMQALLCYPDGSRCPHVNTLIGHHRGLSSELARGQLGYLRALESVGFIAKTQQWYPDAAPWEIGRGEYQINRYWIVGNPPMLADRPELLELQTEGWRSLDEQPVSVRRRELRRRSVPRTAAPP